MSDWLVPPGRIRARINKWRYRNYPELRDALELADLRNHLERLSLKQGLRPLLFDGRHLFVRTLPGFWMWFDPRRLNGMLWGLQRTGEWEPGGVRICLQRLEGGGTFLDVGANLGYYCMAVAVGSESAAIHAFEPVPEIFAGLKLGVEASQLSDRIVLNNLAAAEGRGRLDMIVNGQLSHAVSDEKERRARPITVETISLDDYCREKGIGDVRVIKCDVEGAELGVLRGCRRVLREYKPALVLEIEQRWTRRYGHEPEEIISFLRELGYAGRIIQANGDLTPIPSDAGSSDGLANLFLFEVE